MWAIGVMDCRSEELFRDWLLIGLCGEFEPQTLQQVVLRLIQKSTGRSTEASVKSIETIVIGPPVGSLEQKIDRWVKWIKPFLHCFGQYLSRETIVQVDIDGRAETRELVKECLPHGYREIRCRHVGDLIFKRGRFSWESGYWDDDDRINSRDADGDWGSD